VRVFGIQGSQVQAWPSQGSKIALPEAMPEQGFLWLAFSRSHFEQHLPAIQASLQQLTGQSLVDLHVSDLLNGQLPSRYDFTSH
jgi:hypothetical protein